MSRHTPPPDEPPRSVRSAARVHDDPVLQPERTQLAWVRTTLSFMAVGLLALRLGVTAGIDVSAIILVIVGARG